MIVYVNIGVRSSDVPRWQALGWQVVGGTFCPSLGEHVALVEWRGEGEPRVPEGGE